MLVIASDWHLTDHTTGMRMPVGAYELFQDRLEAMALDASKRDDKTYIPIDSLDLVLLGDIFDPLRSTQWTIEAKGEEGYARPWSDPEDPAFARKVGRITDEIIEENADSLEILRKLAAGEGISLPPATKDHQIDKRVSRDRRSKNHLPVKVNIHYMIGNHDWYYHLPGPAFDQIRKNIVDAMGLSNPIIAFPYEPSESSTLQQVLGQHSVFGRHCDCYDDWNFTDHGRDHASLGDALCVELFNPIGVEIKSALAGDLRGNLPDKFFEDLDEMGSIRPDIMTPVWIASLLERYHASTAQRKEIDKIWHELLSQFLQLDFLNELNRPLGYDPVDIIKTSLGLINFVSIETIFDLAPAIENLIDLYHRITKDSGNYQKYAIKEEAYQSQTARFIVYGHTHTFTVHPLRSIIRRGMPFDQLYLNTGTWHPHHEFCHEDGQKKGFIFYKTMSYLSFYKGDERKGRAYETWSGTLDI